MQAKIARSTTHTAILIRQFRAFDVPSIVTSASRPRKLQLYHPATRQKTLDKLIRLSPRCLAKNPTPGTLEQAFYSVKEQCDICGSSFGFILLRIECSIQSTYKLPRLLFKIGRFPEPKACPRWGSYFPATWEALTLCRSRYVSVLECPSQVII